MSEAMTEIEQLAGRLKGWALNTLSDELRDDLRQAADALSRVSGMGGDDPDEAYEIGKRDGYSEAVQQIDLETGGDGEYRYCMAAHDPERHCPDPEAMKARIVERFTPRMGGDEIERVARALFRCEFRDAPEVLQYEDDEWPGYVEDAQAAIEALSPLRQVATEMLEALKWIVEREKSATSAAAYEMANRAKKALSFAECTCGGDADQPADHHDISCLAALGSARPILKGEGE